MGVKYLASHVAAWITMILLFLCCSRGIYAQYYNPTVFEYACSVKLDSLVSFVEILSGEKFPDITGVDSLIVSRSWNASTHKFAEAYLAKKMSMYGYDVSIDTDTLGSRNVIASPPEWRMGDPHIIVCAHYDAVTDYCADDNASGTALVMEMARILQGKQLPVPIRYAFWDQEERGLVGSRHYANRARSRGDSIVAVLNIVMIGYDGDGDNGCSVLYPPLENEEEHAWMFEYINYALSLKLTINRIDGAASDHRSFLEVGYLAYMLSEMGKRGDFNPAYHTENDRLGLFNLAYFHRLAILGVGTAAGWSYKFSHPVEEPEPEPIPYVILGECYPNPTANVANLRVHLPEEIWYRLTLMDVNGRIIRTVHQGWQQKGWHDISISTASLQPGMYLFRFDSGSMHLMRRLIVYR